MADEQTDIRIGGQTVNLERLTYATIVLMSVLVVYDGWEQLASFVGVALVILGPTLALGVAHLFSEAVHAHAEHGRPLTLAEWRHISANQLHSSWSPCRSSSNPTERADTEGSCRDPVVEDPGRWHPVVVAEPGRAPGSGGSQIQGALLPEPWHSPASRKSSAR